MICDSEYDMQIWCPFQSNMSVHHYRCVALCFVNICQKVRSWAASLASMPNVDRSLQTFRIQVERGVPGGLLHLSGSCTTNRIRLASANSFFWWNSMFWGWNVVMKAESKCWHFYSGISNLHVLWAIVCFVVWPSIKIWNFYFPSCQGCSSIFSFHQHCCFVSYVVNPSEYHYIKLLFC